MSASEIIAELRKLSQKKLEQVELSLHELLLAAGKKSVWHNLLEIAGTAESLPPDYAVQQIIIYPWNAKEMKPVFCDTVYFLALLNPDDHLHDRRIATSNKMVFAR